MYKKITHLFVLSCKRATFLIEKQLHTSLSPLEKLQLRTHLSICKNCAAYKYKAVFIDRLLLSDEQMKEEKDPPFSEEEVDELKEKFKTVMKQKDETKYLH